MGYHVVHLSSQMVKYLSRKTLYVDGVPRGTSVVTDGQTFEDQTSVVPMTCNYRQVTSASLI